MRHILMFLLLITLLFPAGSAIANERRFGFTYESSVLPAGSREIELWNTDRRERVSFYRRLDQRVEYEFGLGNDLMSAVYLNATTKIKDDNGEAPGGSKEAEHEFSFSSEWKWKLSDRVADAFGSALYGELTVAPDETELEAKVIVDKQWSRLLLAANLTGEYEMADGLDNGTLETEKEMKFIASAGCSYAFSSSFQAGIEASLNSVAVDGVWKHSSLFAGPTISYAGQEVWAVLSFLPQVYSLKGATTRSTSLDLDEFEKFQTRLLFSFHL